MTRQESCGEGSRQQSSGGGRRRGIFFSPILLPETLSLDILQSAEETLLQMLTCGKASIQIKAEVDEKER